MRQKILAVSLGVALLPCMAAVTIAVRSYVWWKYEGITFNSAVTSSGRQTHYCVRVRPFDVTLSHHRLVSGSLRPGWLPFSADCAPLTIAGCDKGYRDQGGFGLGGIGLLPGVARSDNRGRMYEASLPHWVLIPLSTVIPALLIRRLRREVRGTNVCTACGYDLRATPDRCPECGRVTKSTRPAA